MSMKPRRIGGIYFLSLGPIGMAVWVSRERKRRMQQRLASINVWWLTHAERYGRMLVP